MQRLCQLPQPGGILMRIALIIAALLLAGCENAKDIPIQPVTIQGDALCDIQKKKLDWDLQDTRPTIDGIRRFNAKWDSRCGKGKTEPTS